MTVLWAAPDSVAGQKEVWKPSGDIWSKFQPSRVFIKGEGTQMIRINWDYIYKKGGKQQGVNHKWSRNSHWSHHGNKLGVMNFMGGEREREPAQREEQLTHTRWCLYWAAAFGTGCRTTNRCRSTEFKRLQMLLSTLYLSFTGDHQIKIN